MRGIVVISLLLIASFAGTGGAFADDKAEGKRLFKEGAALQCYKADPKAEQLRIEELKQLKAERDNQQVETKLEVLKRAAEKPASKQNNLMVPIMEAVKAYATMGEICDTLRDVFGTYKESKLL